MRRKAIKRNDCENYGRDEMVKELLESDQTELKQKLVSYYLEKGMEYFKANEIYKMLKEFYVRNHLDVSLPKVEKKEEENWEAEKEEMAEEHNESADNREQLSATNTEDKSAVIKYEEEEIYFEEEDEPCQSKIE